MQTYLLRPISDAGPNLSIPIGGSAHWAQVDEDPNDGNTTYLRRGADVAAYATFLRIAGIGYFGASHNAGSSFAIVEDDFLVDPSTGQPWTEGTLAALQPGYSVDSIDTEVFGIDASPIPGGSTIQKVTIRSVARNQPVQGFPAIRMTEVILVVQATPPVGRLRSVTSSRAPAAGASSNAPAAVGSGKPPSAAAASSSPRSSVRAQAPGGQAASLAPSARPASSAARAVTPADLPTLKATVSSPSPRGTTSSGSPRASVKGIPPSGDAG